MGFKTNIMALIVTGLLSSHVSASEPQNRVASSAGKYHKTEHANVSAKSAVAIPRTPLSTTGERVRPKAVQQSKSGQIFWIYDAYALLNFDDDGDGFHHNFSVIFDADVDFGEAFVYADLYLSFEGGPWNHYFSTDVFSIEGSTSLDEYEVETLLNSGYPTGYYDVLIELIDADTGELVAVTDSEEFATIAALPLEDADRDFVTVTTVSVGHGGGATGYLLLFLLGSLGAIRKNYITRSGLTFLTARNKDLTRQLRCHVVEDKLSTRLIATPKHRDLA